MSSKIATSSEETTSHLHHVASITSVADIGVKKDDKNEVLPASGCRNVAPVSRFADTDWTPLLGAGLGTVLFATDDWFATAESLLQPGPPQFVADLYCEQGKVLDGWETRRRRAAGHDWCILCLPQCGEIRGIDLDTAHFTGNHVPHVSLQIANATSAQQAQLVSQLPGALERLMRGSGVQGTGMLPSQVQQAEDACSQLEWTELLPKTDLQPGYEATRLHSFLLPESATGTLVRLNYYPDGGVARMCLWGTPTPAPKSPLYCPMTTGPTCTVVTHSSGEVLPSQQPPATEWSSLKHGGRGIACSNKHYGEPWQLLQPNLGRDMGDGWETARHPNRPSVVVVDPKTNVGVSNLSDWAILKLGRPVAQIRRILLDTRHFKGNYPESVLVEGTSQEEDILKAEWFPLVPRTRMSPDAEHFFDAHQLENATRGVTHVRVSMYPDGGLSRVRIYGD